VACFEQGCPPRLVTWGVIEFAYLGVMGERPSSRRRTILIQSLRLGYAREIQSGKTVARQTQAPHNTETRFEMYSNTTVAISRSIATFMTTPGNS
jgi:hypothetical protein